jgi:hypothetical protein
MELKPDSRGIHIPVIMTEEKTNEEISIILQSFKSQPDVWCPVPVTITTVAPPNIKEEHRSFKKSRHVYRSEPYSKKRLFPEEN